MVWWRARKTTPACNDAMLMTRDRHWAVVVVVVAVVVVVVVCVEGVWMWGDGVWRSPSGAFCVGR